VRRGTDYADGEVSVNMFYKNRSLLITIKFPLTINIPPLTDKSLCLATAFPICYEQFGETGVAPLLEDNQRYGSYFHQIADSYI
jgi:hypothetical protein